MLCISYFILPTLSFVETLHQHLLCSIVTRRLTRYPPEGSTVDLDETAEVELWSAADAEATAMDLGMDWLDLTLDLNEPLAHSPALAE